MSRTPLTLALPLLVVLLAPVARAGVPLLSPRARWGPQGVLSWQPVDARVLGRAGERNPCGFESGRAVVDAAWEGDVLVGRVTLCSTCGEKTVPYVGVHVSANGTVVADVPLAPGCDSPGLDHGRLVLAPLADETADRRALSRHLEAGERLLGLRRGKAAQAEFQRALEAHEDAGKAWLGLGLSAILLRDDEAAVTAYERARAYAPSALLSYNLACAQARLRRVDAAVASLADALDRGWAAPDDLEKDPDLAPVRADARFPALVARARANAAPTRSAR